MPDNGSGIYTAPAGTKGVSNTTIESAKQNTWVDDVVAALTNRVAKDGQSTMTGNLKMGSQKITGMAAGTASTDGARMSQVAEGILTTRGDIVVRGASSSERLELGALGAILGSDGTDVVWVTNVLKTDTATQAVATAGDTTLGATRTGGASTSIKALASSGQVGTTTNHAFSLAVNGNVGWTIGTTGRALFANGLSEPSTPGSINVTELLVNNASIPFQKKYESGEIAVTTATSTTYAHSLGALPINVQAVLRCKTTEYGYVVGAEVPLISNNNSNINGSAAYALSATHVGLIQGPALPTVPTTSGAAVITAANWVIVIRAWL